MPPLRAALLPAPMLVDEVPPPAWLLPTPMLDVDPLP